jgi:hypothetical protein
MGIRLQFLIMKIIDEINLIIIHLTNERDIAGLTSDARMENKAQLHHVCRKKEKKEIKRVLLIFLIV